jgi:N-acetylglutamate synthase-like GNAT family acetyltransferase
MLLIKHVIEEGTELDHVRDLFQEYEKELNEDICFQDFEKELKHPLKKYGPPSGDLILAYWEDQIAGCIALTKWKEHGICEMKRLYVKPSFRKNKIGRMLIEDLLTSAKERDYQIMRLDTNISPYYDNPLRGVVYMELEL